MEKVIIKEKLNAFGLSYEDIQMKVPGNKKYIPWILTQLENGHSFADILPTIEYFDRNPHKFDIKDIYRYKDLKDLEDLVKEVSDKVSNRKIREEIKESAPKIFESDTTLVVRIFENKEACAYYGRDTKWCITMMEAQYFEQYMTDNSVFYFIINKKPTYNENGKINPMDKIAVHVARDGNNKILKCEYFNALDEVVSEDAVISYYPELERDSKKQ